MSIIKRPVKVDEQTARKMLDAFYKRYPRIKAWRDSFKKLQ